MIYEVINIHDPITIEADDVKVAMLAVLSWGEGDYALKDEQGRTVVPILRIATEQQTKHWLQSAGIDIEPMSDMYAAQIAACLRTVLISKLTTRAEILSRLGSEESGDLRSAMAKWNEKNRSSMSDICSYALLVAQAYENHAMEINEPPALDLEEV